jgi:hypothetical protein
MSSINFSGSGPGETVLPDPPIAVLAGLSEAVDRGGTERHDRISAIVASHPHLPLVWAELGDVGRDPIESYAAYRVGYHRGLDALRANGWRGSGYVRWVHEGNKGFLRCLEGLMKAAGSIGEKDEEKRCATFLAQLDPSTWGGLIE